MPTREHRARLRRARPPVPGHVSRKGLEVLNSMCGITGYIGKRQAVRVSVDQLQLLEYRGCDSAGVACCSNGHVEVLKAQRKIAGLRALLDQQTPEATVAVAHTRWATHGRPSTPNAHPHTDCQG